MGKLLDTSFPTFQPGPIPNSPPKWVNVYDSNKYWSARRALIVDIKKYFYLNYIAKYNCEASSAGFYKGHPFDIGDYCKGEQTVTTSKSFDVNNIIPPTYLNKPKTIFINMCQGPNNTWTAPITQRYRRTNSQDNGGGAANVSELVTKKRNCYKDYEWNGTKWVKVSENPDTSFFDYTVTFGSSLTLNIFGDSIYKYLDPNSYKVLSDISFNGVYNHLRLKGEVDPNCSVINPKTSTLIFNGKPVSSDVYGLGTACGQAEGRITMNVTWTPSDKLQLI